MNILFLGPSCPSIESHLYANGHIVFRTEEPFSYEWLLHKNCDFGISYRFKHVLPPQIVEAFSGHIINMHISLLPWNRGMDPNLWSFLEDTPKGVTIHRMDAGLDTGDILLQRELHFDENAETLRSTYAKLSIAIENLFIENSDDLLANKVPARPQSGPGSFHYARDKNPWLYLIEEKGWDTPVANISRKAVLQKGR